MDDVGDLLSLLKSKQALVIAPKEVQRVSISVVTSERVALEQATSREQLIQFKKLNYYADVVFISDLSNFFDNYRSAEESTVDCSHSHNISKKT